MSRAPAPAIVASRHRTSARRLSIARRAPAPSRSVMTPVTCGTPASASNAVPPLKSARRKLTSRVECVAHSARIHVISSSLLPEPVTPATTACGPSPTRSMIAGSAAFTTDHRGQAPAARATGASASSSASAIGRSGATASPRLRSARAASSSANCSACSRPTPSASTDGDLAGVIDAHAKRRLDRDGHPASRRVRRARRLLHDEDVGIGRHRLARPDECEPPPRSRTAMRQPLRPGVLAAQRADDAQLPRRQREAQLQRERPMHAGCRGRVPDDRDAVARGHRDGSAGQPRRRELRSAAASGSSPPPVTRSALAASPRPDHQRVAPSGDASPDLAVARDEGGDIGMPRPASPPLGVVALRRSRPRPAAVRRRPQRPRGGGRDGRRERRRARSPPR